MTVLRSHGFARWLPWGDDLAYRRRTSRAVPVTAALFFVLCLLQHPLAHSALPPLIDRSLFFDDPDISGAQISPDGRFLAFLRPLNGTKNIWVKRTDDSLEKAHPITTASDRPVLTYFWSRDSQYILFMRDVGGNEHFNVYAVNPSDAPAPIGTTPVARNLSHGKDANSEIVALPKAFPGKAYIGINDRDKDWQDLYSVDISTGERTLLRKNDMRATDWVFDVRGNLRLIGRTAESGDYEIIRLNKNGNKRIYRCTVVETCYPLQFHPDGKGVYLVSNHGANVDLARLILLNVNDGREVVVEADPENRVDLADAVFSPRSDRLIATRYTDDHGSRWQWRDAGDRTDYELLRSLLPNRELALTPSDDEGVWIVDARADVEPGETYLLDRHTKKISLQYRSFEAIPRSSLATTAAITYPSSDGLPIPAYLTLPSGVEAKALPLIVMAHGGPWARDQWGYMSFTQFLANRGFAVLQPNFRGSTGYGKTFLNAGNRQWGDKMQDDITWGVRHLVAQGIVDPRRVGIFGASYGGYAALAGVAFTPDLYAAAASWVGPSNLPMVVDSLTAFAGPWRNMFYERIGDPRSGPGRAQLERQSPVRSALNIRAPLLAIQGANDPRVKQADTDRIVVALRDNGIPIEYLVAPDEGHVLGVGLGFARPINNQAIFAKLEKFFAQYLGTRYQDTIPGDVARRLSELTVDPRSVSVGK